MPCSIDQRFARLRIVDDSSVIDAGRCEFSAPDRADRGERDHLRVRGRRVEYLRLAPVVYFLLLAGALRGESLAATREVGRDRRSGGAIESRDPA